MTLQLSPDQIAHFRANTHDVMGMRLQELEVTEYWSVIFSARGVATLTKQDMTGFLRYEQNKRWKELSKESVTGNMDALRAALTVLINEDLPVAERLNQLEPARGVLAVPHLGKAKLSAILLVTHPKQYGVWNDYSERSLRGMGLFPDFTPGMHLGEQYVAVNAVLLGLATQYNVGLWWLDIILEKIAVLVR